MNLIIQPKMLQDVSLGQVYAAVYLGRGLTLIASDATCNSVC